MASSEEIGQEDNINIMLKNFCGVDCYTILLLSG